MPSTGTRPCFEASSSSMILRRSQRHLNHPCIDSSWREVQAWIKVMTEQGQLIWTENAYGLRAQYGQSAWHIIPDRQVSVTRPGTVTVWGCGHERHLMAAVRSSMLLPG